MTWIKKIFTLTTLCALCTYCYAQKNIKGEVSDELTGEPLIGATLIWQGTSSGTVTDWDGSYLLPVKVDLPAVLVVSYVGYEPKELNVEPGTNKLKIKLAERVIKITGVEILGQRISEKQKAAPLTVESLDLVAIKETASDNFYDGLGVLKGVDLTSASLGFKVINTRGFNSTSPVRSLQIIDGVDNQAPGLNFSLGNFLGASELDVLKVDIIVGASSAFYGPNAFNGVIAMETKNPFYHKGLGVSLRAGERNLLKGSIRWADAFQNKDGEDFFAYKLNFHHLRANDWEAENYSPVDGSLVEAYNPGRFDAVNIYGDEYFPVNDASQNAAWVDPGLGIYYREGYREIDLVDYNTRNYKANVAFHFRLNPSNAENSSELILASNFGSGTTVYQGDNRFSLKNILFFQNRVELRKKDKYFVRLYATNEDAGDSYDPYATALKLQSYSKSNEDWGVDYRRYWTNVINQKTVQLGYPQLNFPDPYDFAGAANWLFQFRDSLTDWHNIAMTQANLANFLNPDSKDFLRVGTEDFEREFNRLISSKNNKVENGTLFYDKSALYHAHGEVQLAPKGLDELKLGANGRMYRPDSDGTIFSDTAGTTITNWEVGAYAGVRKQFFEKKLKIDASLRVDKNENFPLVATPAASIVWKPRPNNFLRLSFSAGIRNPTLTDQYLNLNVGRATLAGNLNGAKDLITVESFGDYRAALNIDTLVRFDVDPVVPEKVKTFEIGYRGTLSQKFYVDAGYYYSIYDDFLGYQIGLDVDFNVNGLATDIEAFRFAANSKNQVRSQGFSIGGNYYFGDFYKVAGNYSWNQLVKTIENDPIIPAYNTPEHKFNIGLSGRNINTKIGGLNIKNFGFNINYKWIEGFFFEGSPQFTGPIPSYDLLDAQINYNHKPWHTTFKLGASNILDNQHFETYGGPLIGRMAYISLLYDFKKK